MKETFAIERTSRLPVVEADEKTFEWTRVGGRRTGRVTGTEIALITLTLESLLELVEREGNIIIEPTRWYEYEFAQDLPPWIPRWTIEIYDDYRE